MIKETVMSPLKYHFYITSLAKLSRGTDKMFCNKSMEHCFIIQKLMDNNFSEDIEALFAYKIQFLIPSKDHFPGLEVLQLDGEKLNNTSEDSFYNKFPFILEFLVFFEFKTISKDHFC